MTKIGTQPLNRNPMAGIKPSRTRDGQPGREDLERRMREAFAMEMSGRPPGEKFLFWLGEAARRLREEAGLGPAAIAAALERREATVESFEKGVNMPRDLEALLAVYAKLTGVGDSRDIVRDALRLWYEHGEAPTLSPPAEDPADTHEPPADGSTPQPSPPGSPPTLPSPVEPETDEEDQRRPA